MSAADVELTKQDLTDIENALSGLTVQGARYPQHLQALTNK
jgi:hypothetical protein